MPTTPDIPEGLELHKDGTITLVVDLDDAKTKRIRLRRPKMKELRRLRETEWEIAAEIQSFTVSDREKLQAFREEHGIDLTDPTTMVGLPVAVLAEYNAAQTDLNQKGTTFAESLRGPWAVETIAVLGAVEVEEDDLPPWCFGPEFAAHLLGHWLAVPTRRGSP